MPLPPWLDRIWLVVIAVAFAIAAPIWLILMSERFGWRVVAATLGTILISAYLSRRRPDYSSNPRENR